MTSAEYHTTTGSLMPRLRRTYTEAEQERWLQQADSGWSVRAIVDADPARPAYGTVQSTVYRLRQKRALTEAPEAHAFLCMSDEHVGIWAHPEDSNGMYEYSVEIAAQRFLLLEQLVTQQLEAMSRHWRVTRLHVAMLGDHIQGEAAYAGAAYRLQLSRAEWQSAAYVEMVGPMLRRLAGAVTRTDEEPAVVVLQTPGNHSRVGSKGECDPHSSWERTLFADLRQSLADMPSVAWVEPRGKRQGLVHPLSGLRVVMAHGDRNLRVNYTGSPTPMTWPSFEASARHLGMNGWDIGLAGHRHVPAYVGGEQSVFSNGSFCGATDLAVDAALKPTPACQWFLGVCAEGLCWTQNLVLSWPTSTTVDELGVVRGDIQEGAAS